MVTNELNKVEDNVMFLLEKKPSLRDSDKKLIIAYLLHTGQNIKRDKRTGDLVFRFNPYRIGELPSFESITRSRRRIQNTYGLYLPTKESIARQRRIKEEVIRAYYQ